MSDRVPQSLEIVTFRLARGSVEAFVAANAAVNDWLRRQPGFISRHLAEHDDGRLVDAVLWQSHDAALAAAAKMMEEMAQSEAMTMIDPVGLEMSHARIRLSIA
ncbi:MAG: antibiotic biosynthesis monooxygenase [Devosia sp.]|nr:antibiotic biosynthesis monooxygenase [Devosia sp.]